MKKTIFYAKYTAGVILVFLLFFTMGSAISAYMLTGGVAPESTDEDTALLEEEGERTNILVLGVDARPGEKNSRSDTMLLVSIDPKLDKAAIISIPRDTRLNVPGSPLDKICTANYVGGPEYAVKIVEDFMGINIDYYMKADFKGFQDIIDTLGGVTINVPQRMYKPSEGIDLYPGLQELDGYKALAFVRYRGYAYGDIERTSHQQDFLVALADEILQPKTIPKLPTLIKEVRNYVKTDIGLKDMLKIASWAPGFTRASLVTQTLPGYFYDVYNEQGLMEQSYWVADQDKARSLINNLMAGKTVAVIQTSPYSTYVPTGGNKDTGEDADTQRTDLPSPGNDGDVSEEDVSNDGDPGLPEVSGGEDELADRDWQDESSDLEFNAEQSNESNNSRSDSYI